MRDRFQNGLVKVLIERNDFMPVTDQEGNMWLDGDIRLLMNHSSKGSVVIEILNGNALTYEQIVEGLRQHREVVGGIESSMTQTFFEVFVFEQEPEQEKLEAITNAEIHDLYGKRFFKSISVVLDSQEVRRHYAETVDDRGLLKAIEQFLESGDMDKEEVGTAELEEAAARKLKENRLELKVERPLATYALIGINLLIGALLYLYSLKSGTSYTQLLYDFGAKVNDRIIAGEYFRFVTPIFLHAGLTHLLINCFSLYAVGINVERIFGRAKFLGIYFAAGILGNVASFMFSPNWGVGASGAIFGLMGSLLYFGLQRPVLFRKIFGNDILLTIVINLVYGFSTTGIDNYAHIGGLIGGFLAIGAISRAERPKWYMNKFLYAGLLVVALAGGVFYGFGSDQGKAAVLLSELQKHDKASEWSKAITTGKEILDLEPQSESVRSEVLWSLVKAEAMTGNSAEAVKYAYMLKTVDPVNGHYMLGLLYYDQQDYVMAKEELTAAKNAGATYEQIDKLLEDMK